MTEVMVVISGEITDEYEEGLYKIIDEVTMERNLPVFSRDAVIDVFDVVAYYDHSVDLVTQSQWWVDLFLRLRNHKGLKNVELTMRTDDENL